MIIVSRAVHTEMYSKTRTKPLSLHVGESVLRGRYETTFIESFTVLCFCMSVYYVANIMLSNCSVLLVVQDIIELLKRFPLHFTCNYWALLHKNARQYSHSNNKVMNK